MNRLFLSIITCISLICTLILLQNCNTSQFDELNKLDHLHQHENKIRCALTSLGDSATHIWNNVNTIIDQHVGNNMPPKEKHNLLKVRNANLIRMFQSYEAFPEDVKGVVNNAELMDSLIVTDITRLKKSLDSIEQKKLQLFNTVQNKISADQFKKLIIQYNQRIDCKTIEH